MNKDMFKSMCEAYTDDEVCNDCCNNSVMEKQSCYAKPAKADAKNGGTDKIHPDHYKLDGGREVIDVIKMMLTEDELRGFCKGNYIKYYMRAGKKSGESAADDLKKAEWYFKYLEQLEFLKEYKYLERVDVGQADTLGKFEIR